jgi:hypothetical protein
VAGIAGLLLAGGALLGGGDALPARVPVRLLTDVEEPRLVDRLRELLVGAVPIFERETGRCLPENRVLVVNLHRTLRGYQRGARLAGVSGFMEVGAVTAWSDHESHIALQPRGDAAYLEAVGWLPDLTAQLALHEAAHQFLARAEVYPTLALPSWYSEGVADHLAEVALRELLYADGRRCLMLDDARRNVARAVESGRAIPLAELFTLGELELDGHAHRDLFYDQSTAVVRYLAGEGLERWGNLFQGYLDELAGAGDEVEELAFLDGRARRRERWLELVADLPAFEEAWRGALQPAAAPWIERQGSSQWVGEDVLVAALSWQDNGYLQAAEPAPAGARRFEGEFALFGLDGSEAFVVLHEPESSEGGLKLGLRGDGLVSLIGWRADKSDVRVLRSGLQPRRDAFVRVALEHEQGRLAVRLDDEAPLVFELPPGYPPPGGGWGLGAHRDAVLWRGAGWR